MVPLESFPRHVHLVCTCLQGEHGVAMMHPVLRIATVVSFPAYYI